MTSIACIDITQFHDSQLASLYAQASLERKTRADTVRRRSGKLRCLAGEALVRYALGADVLLAQDQWGKPYPVNKPGLHFNLSHSGDWVVIAWGSSPVGIDIEQIRSNVKWELLLKRHFTPEEQSFVLEKDAIARFFELWTAKESYLKYLGQGLTRPLADLNVLSLGDPQRYRIFLEGYSLTLFAKEPPDLIHYLTPKDIFGKEQDL